MLYRKSKGKVHPATGHEGPEGEERYSCTLSLTSALDGRRVINATPQPLYPRGSYPVHCRGGRVGPRAGVDRCGKSRPQQELEPPTVQSVANGVLYCAEFNNIHLYCRFKAMTYWWMHPCTLSEVSVHGAHRTAHVPHPSGLPHPFAHDIIMYIISPNSPKRWPDWTSYCTRQTWSC
jgi:hypothetical protein